MLAPSLLFLKKAGFEVEFVSAAGEILEVLTLTTADVSLALIGYLQRENAHGILTDIQRVGYPTEAAAVT